MYYTCSDALGLMSRAYQSSSMDTAIPNTLKLPGKEATKVESRPSL